MENLPLNAFIYNCSSIKYVNAGEVVIQGKDLSNIEEETYYPIVRTGGCVNILNEGWDKEFSDFLIRVIRSGELGGMVWNKNLSKKVITCAFDEDATYKLQFSSIVEKEWVTTGISHNNNFLQDISTIVDNENCKVIIIRHANLGIGHAGIKDFIRDCEDFAEKHEVAIILFWEYQNREEQFDPCYMPYELHHYFSRMGHNTCHLGDFEFENTVVIVFEWGGIRPKRIILTWDADEMKLKRNRNFEKALKLWGMFKNIYEGQRLNPSKEPDGYIQAGYLKYEINGYQHETDNKKSIERELSFATDIGMLKRIGTGNQTRYKYLQEWERRFGDNAGEQENKK